MSHEQGKKEVWASGAAYEPYVGRWSRVVAREFLAWLGIAPHADWLDVGCGTGALTQTILAVADPAAVKGIDKSEGFAGYAREQVQDARATFQVGDAQQLPVETNAYDAVVSGLVLNFVPQTDRAVAEIARATKEGGTAAVYVWDYAGKLAFMQYCWNTAVALEPSALELDEGRRFPICNPQALSATFQAAGLKHVETRGIEITTHYKDFDDYWQPFLGGQGAAPAYVMTLSEEKRNALRDKIRGDLPFAADGSLSMVARAWAVKGVK